MSRRPRKGRSDSPGARLTDEQMYGGTVHVVSRLRDHLERLDNGVVVAADDMAVVLRALLTKGHGCDVLGRFARRFDLEPPVLSMSGPARRGDYELSVGALPCLPYAAADTGGGPTAATKIRDLAVCTLDGVTYTWDSYLRDYANKWGGAHLDETIPQALLHGEVHAVGDMPLPAYLLRMIGSAVWHVCQQLLSRVAESWEQTPADATGGILTAEGASGEPPRDISGAELLMVAINSTDADFCWLVPERPCTCGTFRIGGISYDIAYCPPGQEAPVREPVRRQRVIGSAGPQAPVVVSPERTVRVTGRCLPKRQHIDPA